MTSSPDDDTLTNEAFAAFLVSIGLAVAQGGPEFRQAFSQMLDGTIELALNETEEPHRSALAKCYRMLQHRIETASKAADGTLLH